jgi:hypothetical protein
VALQNLKRKIPELLDRLGLSDVALIEKHLKPLLSAQTTKFFQRRGKVTGNERLWVGVSLSRNLVQRYFEQLSLTIFKCVTVM